MALYKELKEIDAILRRWDTTPPTNLMSRVIRWWMRGKMERRKLQIVEILSIKKGGKNLDKK